ncbi:hypothetical protein J19TS2_26130 [Cohnella xylanilytica]|nr:hypothetical protein J19TS2_26130 [Cohnella xylanilytica]
MAGMNEMDCAWVRLDSDRSGLDQDGTNCTHVDRDRSMWTAMDGTDWSGLGGITPLRRWNSSW